ncbi:MAG TPA: ATP-binding protein, partial [Leucothrix sp.]|nr:ATP-binding protein [Leucothrix sp.]
LDNAFKYTPKNGAITLNATSDERSNINIRITDNGSGIPEDEYDKVFKRFHRLDSARSTEGNGLGLSLVKAVADLHDAEIRLANNKPGLIVDVIFNNNKQV